MDVTNRRDLEASLSAWKRDLDRQTKAYSRATKSREALLKRIQVAKANVARRQAQLDKLPGPRAKALKQALSFVGTVEQPAGSNTGAAINVWQSQFGMHGQPWCGAFVGAMVNAAGAKVSNRIVYTPYIYADAIASQHGLERAVWKDVFLVKDHVAHSGDLVLFDFGAGGIKHVGMLRKPWNGKGPLYTVEGNTSFGNGGSQDNGGAVALRERDIALVHSIVRVQWPA